MTETVDVETNPVPVKVMLALAAPTGTSDGATLDRTGVGLVTVKDALLALTVEALPVDVFSTLICNWVPELSWAMVNVACTCVLLANVVAIGVPFTVTEVDEVNPVPITAIVTLELPAGTFDGFTDWTLNAAGWVGEDGDEVPPEPPHPAVKRQANRQNIAK